jgi:hypothetical protein
MDVEKETNHSNSSIHTKPSSQSIPTLLSVPHQQPSTFYASAETIRSTSPSNMQYSFHFDDNPCSSSSSGLTLRPSSGQRSPTSAIHTPAENSGSTPSCEIQNYIVINNKDNSCFHVDDNNQCSLSTLQSSSELLMTPIKKTTRVPRAMSFKTPQTPPKISATFPSKPSNKSCSTVPRKLINKNQAIRKIQLTPKSLRIKMKNRLLSIYRSQIQRLKRQKCNASVTAKESEINSIIASCSKYLDPNALNFFFVSFAFV